MEEIKKGERHPLAHEKGGFRLQDPDKLIPSATKEVLKKIGSKLISMKFFDLMKISAPAKIAYPTTYLEWFLNDYTFFPRFMKEVWSTKDNIERIKYLTSWIIAGLHVGEVVLQALSPLNPILGETCQRYSPDGTKYYAEQISHHPPISAMMMEGPDQKWKFQVIQEFRAGLNGHNSIKAHKQGDILLTLFDGTQYTIEEGWINIDGLVYGELVVCVWGKIVIKDTTHNLTSEVQFDPDNQEGIVSSVTSKLKFWESKKAKRPADHFDVEVFEELKGKRSSVCKGKGSYLEYIQFEDEKYWEMGDEWGEWIKPDEVHLLKSDSSLREDLQFIKTKDYVKAQESKEAIEEQQRTDKKLRLKKK